MDVFSESRPPESILLGSRNASEKEPTVSETVLPPLSPDSVTDKLPRDPSDLLTGDERHQLDDDLAQLAQLRREAETASASLRLA